MTRISYLGSLFDPRANALNAIRLCLAVLVIVWHSFPLTGSAIDFWPVRQFFEHFGVDGFFAVSGFLIVSSWSRNPHWASYLRARVLRIFPAFWACLLVTACLFAPLSVVMARDEFSAEFPTDAIAYVLRNSFLLMQQYGIEGTLDRVPLRHVWDGSLWTLLWEFICYLGVLGLGLVGLLRRSLTLPIAFVIALCGVAVTSYGTVDNYWIDRASQLGVMFIAGGMLYQYRDRVPVSGFLIVAAGGIVAVSLLLPDYRIVAAVPVAYLILVLGAITRSSRLHLRNDFSYGTYIYAFPVQQLLATAGAAGLGATLFGTLAIVLTLPLAAASWFLVERPALRLKVGKRATEITASRRQQPPTAALE